MANARVKRIQKVDLNILYDLYRYRVLTTDHIKRKYFLTANIFVDRKINMIRNSGWIITFLVPRKDGRKGKTHHRITDRGINVLRVNGYSVKHKSFELHVTDESLPYLIEANNIMVELSPYGWFMRDSRETKERYNMNRGDQMHGTLTHQDGRVWLFRVGEGDTRQKHGESGAGN